MTKPKRKTKYCKHHLICDREEDCFKGQYCPVQESNPYFSALSYTDGDGKDRFVSEDYEDIDIPM